MSLINVFQEGDCDQKLQSIESAIHGALQGKICAIPAEPARGNAPIRPPQFHPPKKGLASKEGRARLLHDLASIEMQAMELALRTLIEYPEAPTELRDELAELTRSESRHLRLCIDTINDLGFHWGDWPVHIALWQAVRSEDSLIDRMFIVHRYLEGSGLDAQDTILRRLEGVPDRSAFSVVQQIHREEIDHVYFGSRWYGRLLKDSKLDGFSDLRARLLRLRPQLPKRIEPICHKWRLQAGFSPEEIEVLEDFRGLWQR